MDINSCIRELKISNHTDSRGGLFSLEIDERYFSVLRVYYIKKVGLNEIRGSHAHKTLSQIFIPISGTFDLIISDGESWRNITIQDCNIAYALSAGFWRELRNFSEDAICLVLASDHYDENDYIRSYDEFQTWRKNEK